MSFSGQTDFEILERKFLADSSRKVSFHFFIMYFLFFISVILLLSLIFRFYNQNTSLPCSDFHVIYIEILLFFNYSHTELYF
jgi:hypothetical protein